MSIDAETFAAVLDLLVEGKSLMDICDEFEGISRSSFYRYLDATEGAWDSYTRAKERGVEADLDHLDRLARDVVYSDLDPSAVKVACDIKKWSMGRRNRAFDSAVKIDHTSSDGSMTPSALDVSKLSTEAMRELLAARGGDADKPE